MDLLASAASISDYSPADLASGAAPANFADAEDSRPTAALFDIGGHGSTTPYSNAVGAIANKHMDEIRMNVTLGLNLRNAWRRSLHDFITRKNTELLDFIKLSPSSHTTISRVEALLHKFGNPQVHPNHPSVRDLVLDISGEDVLGEINTALDNVRQNSQGGLQDYARQTELLYHEYRTAGDEILQEQARLNAKLNKLDKVQGRIATLLDLDTNECYGPLMEATEAYIKKVFEESKIEANYKALIAAYRRFVHIRDIVVMARSLSSQENQPLCSVCLQDPVCYALTPCGHTFCQGCSRKQRHTCFICRANIKDTVKLYFT